MKKVIVMGLVASSMFLTMACDEGDVAAGVIGVGIGAAVGAHAGYGNGYHDGRHDGWNRGGGYYGPGYGRGGGYGPGYGRGGYDRGGWDRGHRGFSDVQTANVNAESDSASVFAEKYHITKDASKKIETAFADVQTKGITVFENIGLNKSDLKKIATKQIPEAESLKNVAQKLDMSEAQSGDLIKDMITEFTVQSSDVNSDYWQSCMAQGTWKTGDNANCSSADWKGCSPATGASLCY
jgi:hypothetical protein